MFLLHCSVVLKEEQLDDPRLTAEEEDEGAHNVFTSDWLPPKKDKMYSFIFFCLYLQLFFMTCFVASLFVKVK
jgi:hypothetical protein